MPDRSAADVGGASNASGPDRPTGLARLRSFEIINENPTSTVYRALQALDDDVDRLVAVKVLRGVKPERAIRELKLAIALGEHTNIITVYDIARTNDGQPTIIMEYCPGGSLADYCGQMSPGEVLAAGIGVADALVYAHERGVLHRDVKPDNILVRNDALPQSSSYVLTDFGTARLTHAPHTTSIREGSYFYSSPRQFQGEPPDVVDDIWSLGATLFALVDGAPPFAVMESTGSGNEFAAYALRVVSGEPRDLCATDLPDQLRAIIARCLETSPQRHFPSAAHVRDALRSVKVNPQHTAAPKIATSAGPRGLSVPTTQPEDDTPEPPQDDRPAAFSLAHASEHSPPTDGINVDEPPPNSRRGSRTWLGRHRRLAIGLIGAVAGFTLAVTFYPLPGDLNLNRATARSTPGPLASPATSGQPTIMPTTPATSRASAKPRPGQPVAPSSAAPPMQQCATSFRAGPYAATICWAMRSDGFRVFGQLHIYCNAPGQERWTCGGIIIREVQLIMDGVTRTSWQGGMFPPPELTTEEVWHMCMASARYSLKALNVRICYVDGTCSSEEAVMDSPFTYRCL